MYTRNEGSRSDLKKRDEKRVDCRKEGKLTWRETDEKA
jgi:hypothetical protein